MGIRKVAGIAMLAVSSASVASAQAVNFQGSTTGCFYVSAGAPCASPGSSPTSFQALTFTGSSFNQTSNGADGQLSLSNLGSFVLTSSGQNYNGESFRLFITFTVPTINGQNPVNYTSVLTGNLTGGGSNINIDFDNTPQLISFQGGSLSFFVQDQSVQALNVPSVVSGFGVVTTPEPSSMALLGTGLFGLVPMIRRKK